MFGDWLTFFYLLKLGDGDLHIFSREGHQILIDEILSQVCRYLVMSTPVC